MQFKVSSLKFKVSGWLLWSMVCGLLAFSSCKNKLDDYTFEYLYEYFPTDTGHYVVYNVDSIIYNSSSSSDTVHYQLMEKITDTTYDNQNELAYVLELYRRSDSTQSWYFDRKWWLKKTQFNVQKIEDDLRFVKLVFPPAYNKAWDGNTYIASSSPFEVFRNWDYHYTSVNYPYAINGFSFDSSLTVSEVNDSDFISKRLRKEIYVKHVGMVYQDWKSVNLQPDLNGVPHITSGFDIKMRMVDYH